jgi:hypothetical protein
MMQQLKLSLILFLLFLVFHIQADKAFGLTVSTLNIKFYGFQKNKISTKKNLLDPRNESLKHYIAQNLIKSDIISFEEIIDVENFISKVVPQNFKCQSYTRKRKSHLHVVVCYQSKYQFLIPGNDTNHIIESTTLGRNLRPVVHGVLATKTGKPLAYLAAVHLKASKPHSATRNKQVTILAQFMKTLPKGLDKIIVGDFNTHGNDISSFNRILNHANLSMRHLSNKNRYTYRSNRFNSKLDHYWVSSTLKQTRNISTSRICNDTISPMGRYADVAEYNKEISDHCFLKANFKSVNNP